MSGAVSPIKYSSVAGRPGSILIFKRAPAAINGGATGKMPPLEAILQRIKDNFFLAATDLIFFVLSRHLFFKLDTTQA